MIERIDKVLVSLNYSPTRSQARLLIKEGAVFYKGKKVDKPGLLVESRDIEVKKISSFVGRGGDKLESVLIDLDISVKNMVIADIGASTGGFTDVVLKRGAQKVYAVDVGKDQLALELKNDERVYNLEGINIKTGLDLPEKVDLCVVDLSFISLKLTLENIFSLIHEQGSVLALVKPQFEAGKNRIGKKGVIKDPSVRLDVLFELYDWCYEKGMILDSAIASPIQGKLGNQEYFFHLFKESSERRQMKRSSLLSIVVKEEKN